MKTAEIENAVLLGNHGLVKSFYAPLVAQLKAMFPEASVFCSGRTVSVVFEADNFISTKNCWVVTWTSARSAVKAFPQYKVTTPKRSTVDGGTWTIIRDSFTVGVR